VFSKVMAPSTTIQSLDQPSNSTSVDETSFMDEPAKMMNSPVMTPPRSIALDATSFNVESSESMILQEWRAIRSQQDNEYNESLLADIEKERRRRCYEVLEERRKKAIEDRRQQIDAQVEPPDGEFLKVKYPNGDVRKRKFIMSDPIQEKDDPTNAAYTCVGSPKPQSPVPLSYVEPVVDLFTTHSAVFNLNAVEPTEPVVIAINEETPLSSPFSQPTDIIDVSLDQEMAQEKVDLQSILAKLHNKIDSNLSPTANQINVFRENILQCSLQAFRRQRFNPQAKLDVVFVDAGENVEGAIDEGGPTREYLRLLMRAIHQANIFQGPEKDRSLALDTHALESKMYSAVGKMISVCVVHGGVGPHFFSERLFQQVCGLPTSPVSLDEIGDHSLMEQLIKIQEATTVAEANSAIADAADSLNILGALRHITDLSERTSLVQSAGEFYLKGRVQVALDQLSEGFKTLGLLEELQKHPALFYDMFVKEQRPLLAKDLSSLFQVDFSPQGSNKRSLENRTICYWRDWLIDVEEGEINSVTLESIMEFATGASTIPPLGFPHQPEIQFLHQDGKIFPEANTCLITLRLPVHAEYETFKTYMREGIIQSPCFGVV
ncbi:hypothetical protein DNTS_022286, partial [Danionella cerebrum]